MTWKTSMGDRVLSGPEANLFASSLGSLIDYASDGMGEGLNFGIRLVRGPFERLPLAQQYAVLEETTRALLLPTDACPPLTAVNESAIYYVYAYLRQQFRDDIESAEEVWGELVIDAFRSVIEPGELEEDEEDSSCPALGCFDADKWDMALECLADAILWDRDFEVEAQFEQPGMNLDHMNVMGIDRLYFMPYRDHAPRGAKARLSSLVRGVLG